MLVTPGHAQPGCGGDTGRVQQQTRPLCTHSQDAVQSHVEFTVGARYVRGHNQPGRGICHGPSGQQTWLPPSDESRRAVHVGEKWVASLVGVAFGPRVVLPWMQ